MSSPATFCDLPISTGFDGHAATSCVSLDWVIKSGLRTHNSQASGLLTLPCDVGAISMFLNNLPVTASLPSDLLLGLDWFNFVQFSAPELVVHLDSGSLDLRGPSLLTVGITESGPPSSTVTPAVTPVFRGGTSVDHPSSSPSVSLGNPDAVSAPSLVPRTRGIDVVAHEREDVVAYRAAFVKRFLEEYEPRMWSYDNDGNPIQQPEGFVLQGKYKGQPFRIILVTHDESTFYANDRRKVGWGREQSTKTYLPFPS
ncbi:hypothetical protein B0H10DRAFT_2219354 [Mycena sp. CBHHK59/15]|nr:hypothetical protein B0H10DRAFT_2219354 [Mycena sp. CBHHK59/15]